MNKLTLTVEAGRAEIFGREIIVEWGRKEIEKEEWNNIREALLQNKPQIVSPLDVEDILPGSAEWRNMPIKARIYENNKLIAKGVVRHLSDKTGMTIGVCVNTTEILVGDELFDDLAENTTKHFIPSFLLNNIIILDSWDNIKSQGRYELCNIYINGSLAARGFATGTRNAIIENNGDSTDPIYSYGITITEMVE